FPSDSADESGLVVQHLLDAIVEFTGAEAGWVGLTVAGGRPSFPARSGAVPGSWLRPQQGQLPAWGFVLGDGRTLLNHLPALAALGDPPLRQVLACPVRIKDAPAGHLVLANKAHGFTPHDVGAAQTAAHLLGRILTSRTTTSSDLPASLLRI